MKFARTFFLAPRNRLIFTLVVGFVLTGAAIGAFGLQMSRAIAVTCAVPSVAYPTIQSAVDDALCDEIDVAAGNYTESVSIERSLTLRGAGDEQTILDGENSRRPLVVGLSASPVIDNLVGASVYVYIEDLAVRNGNATTESPTTPPVNSGRIGGGILVRNRAAAYLTNLRVYNNIGRASGTGSGFGGGIGVYGGSELHLQNVRVYGNTASTSPNSGFGGGIASLSSSLYMTNTYVYQNIAKNNTGGQGQGGGIYVENFSQDTLYNPSYSYARIWNSEIYSNTAAAKGGAGYGGGLYAGETDDTHLWLYDNLWRGNVARGEQAGSGDGYGGAIAFDVQTGGAAYLDLYGDEFRQNAANAYVGLAGTDKAQGGAIYLDANATGLLTGTLENPYFVSNYAESGSGSTTEQGGAIYTRFSKVSWTGGKATGNRADRNNPAGQGGVVRTLDAPLSIYEAELYDNVANEGGAVYSRNDDINLSGYLRMRNVMAGDNEAASGAGVYFANSNNTEDSWLRHVTLADENGNAGQAIYVVKGNLEIKNSIIANHATGIQSAVPQAVEDYNLFANNAANTGGAVGIGGNSITGNPQFVSPAARDYHIGSASDARNLGTDLGIAFDIDGEPRDNTPDAGADEYTAATPTPTNSPTATNTPPNTETPTPTATPTTVQVTKTVTVEVVNNEFIPASITINVGDTVVWKRVEGFHNVVEDNDKFRLGENPAGDPGASWETVSYTFTEVGTYGYYCEVHGSAGGIGMAGEVIVQEQATPTPTSTTETPTPTSTTVESPTSTSTPTATPQTVTVEVGNNFFSPASVTINVGDTIVWKRLEGFHNVRSDEGFFRLGNENGDVSNTWDTVSFTFTEPGVYPYYCEAHGQPGGVGMAGEVIVLAPPTPTSTSTPLASPSTTTTPDATPSPSTTPEGTPSSTTTPSASTTPSTPTSTPTPSATPGPGVPEDIVISEMYYTGDANGDWIELKNSGSGRVDVSSWQLCAIFSYKALSEMEIIDPTSGQTRAASAADLILDPGEYLVLRSWMDLGNASDMALYTAPDFGSPSALVDFVQWGTPEDVGRADVAAAKGIWPQSTPGPYDFVPTAAAGESLALVSSNAGTAASDFRNGPPTQGRSNTSSGSTKMSVYLPLVER